MNLWRREPKRKIPSDLRPEKPTSALSVGEARRQRDRKIERESWREREREKLLAARQCPSFPRPAATRRSIHIVGEVSPFVRHSPCPPARGESANTPGAGSPLARPLRPIASCPTAQTSACPLVSLPARGAPARTLQCRLAGVGPGGSVSATKNRLGRHRRCAHPPPHHPPALRTGLLINFDGPASLNCSQEIFRIASVRRRSEFSSLAHCIIPPAICCSSPANCIRSPAN